MRVDLEPVWNRRFFEALHRCDKDLLRDNSRKFKVRIYG